MTKQLIETMEKQIGKIEKAIRKYTTAQNAHDMSRRHPISEDRNQLAGDVFETRQQLESILSTVTEELDAAKADMCDDAHELIAPISVEMISEGAKIALSVAPDLSVDDAGTICVGSFMAMMSGMDGGTNRFFNEAEGEIYTFGEMLSH